MPPRRTLISPSAVTGDNLVYGVVSTMSCTSMMRLLKLFKNKWNIPEYCLLYVCHRQVLSVPESLLHRCLFGQIGFRAGTRSAAEVERRIYRTCIKQRFDIAMRRDAASMTGTFGWSAAMNVRYSNTVRYKLTGFPVRNDNKVDALYFLALTIYGCPIVLDFSVFKFPEIRLENLIQPFPCRRCTTWSHFVEHSPYIIRRLYKSSIKFSYLRRRLEDKPSCWAPRSCYSRNEYRFRRHHTSQRSLLTLPTLDRPVKLISK
jgi:hypothetical protein